MVNRPNCIPSSSSHDMSMSSPNGEKTRVGGVVPAATNRVVSNIKPFLLGFVLALILIGFAALSSVRVVCQDYKHSGHSTESLCAPEPVVAEKDVRRQLQWREAIPFVSAFAPKKNGKRHNRDQPTIFEANNTDVTGDRRNEPGVDSDCFCHFLWEAMGYTAESSPMICTDDNEAVRESEQEERWRQARKEFPTAFTPEISSLTSIEQKLVLSLRENVLKSVSEFEHRASLVPWGGSGSSLFYDWYNTKKQRSSSGLSPLETIEGGNLFYAYLRIMKWPTDLSETEFPFKLCKAMKKNEGKACDATVALRHTLEFRERYKPWLVSPGIKHANSRGLVYHRGFSPPYSQDDIGGHAIVWMRLARKVQSDTESERIFFVRSMIREFDRAVAASLRLSNGRLGKFNCIIDGKDFTWANMPSLGAVKTLVAILQDHFADRLGVVILVNMGSIGELLLKLFLPLITEEVRNKILVVPHDPQKRVEKLELILGSQNAIPVGLGGTDTYEFNVDDYYANEVFGTDEQALEYLTTMPYHAQ